MVLALKLITAGVSYQDGLKKPEVTPSSCPAFLAQVNHKHRECVGAGLLAVYGTRLKCMIDCQHAEGLV